MPKPLLWFLSCWRAKGIWLLWLYFFAYSQCYYNRGCLAREGRRSSHTNTFRIPTSFFLFHSATHYFNPQEIVDIDWCWTKTEGPSLAMMLPKGSKGCPGEQFNWVNFLKRRAPLKSPRPDRKFLGMDVMTRPINKHRLSFGWRMFHKREQHFFDLKVLFKFMIFQSRKSQHSFDFDCGDFMLIHYQKINF